MPRKDDLTAAEQMAEVLDGMGVETFVTVALRPKEGCLTVMTTQDVDTPLAVWMLMSMANTLLMHGDPPEEIIH